MIVKNLSQVYSLILCFIFLLLPSCSLSHISSSCYIQKKNQPCKRGAQLEPQVPCSCPGRVWHLGHAPFPLTLFIQGIWNIRTTSSSWLSGAVFLCTCHVTSPGLIQNWWAVHKCHMCRANLLPLWGDSTAPPAQDSASKDEQKTGVSTIAWIFKVLGSCPWHSTLHRYFRGGCVWNGGSAEGTSPSTTGEGRQGMAIFWDQKKANSLLILQ